MKTVKESCKLQDNALTLTLSDQVEHLEGLIDGEGDGSAFFERTFITQGMQDLIHEGVARLSGHSDQAIFELKQAMGGGKTHLLVGFGLLAKSPELRLAYCPSAPGSSTFGEAKIAAFSGRHNPKEFFWGALAEQLGGAGVFSKFWVEGPKAPEPKDWEELFGNDPTLILLDELPPYFQYMQTAAYGVGVADIVTRALANLLEAAGRKTNVCVVVSDLTVSYEAGGKLINKALKDAQAELGRQVKTITPVDLATEEIYDILRKRLFASLPSRAEIDDLAARYAAALEEAAAAKTVARTAEAIADDISRTYPFHPSLKNIIALFKENPEFKQTRGLIELISKLLKSVWEGNSEDVYLIGAQHFDLSISDVREKLAEISRMREVITNDIWDSSGNARAQVIDAQRGNFAAQNAATLLLTASLSTAVNAVRGLTRQELAETLITPINGATEFLTAVDELEKAAWYLHVTPENRVYFDKQENLIKVLQDLAEGAPAVKIDGLLKDRLTDMFKPTRKVAYQEVIPLPNWADAAEHVRRNRVLLIVSPDSKIPPEQVEQFFSEVTEKNNVCVLTGDKTMLATLETAARQVYAAEMAKTRIRENDPQMEELDRKLEDYRMHFNTTVWNLFDKVLFPVQRAGREPQLVAKALDPNKDPNQPYNGEQQIEKTLTSDPLKLYSDVNASYDAIREKAEDLLWPPSGEIVRWSDVSGKYAEQPSMPWIPPRGLEELKGLALARGAWEDLGDGRITKKPEAKKTSVGVIKEHGPDDEGRVRLFITVSEAGSSPEIHYAENRPVTTTSPRLEGNTLETTALHVNFLAVDPTGRHETGSPVTWSNELKIRNSLGPDRTLTLSVVPQGAVWYTLNGSEPRNGVLYSEPFAIGDDKVEVLVFAKVEDLEQHASFKFPSMHADGKEGFPTWVDQTKPAKMRSERGRVLDSRARTFTALKRAAELGVKFEKIQANVSGAGQSAKLVISATIAPDKLRALVENLAAEFEEEAQLTMMVYEASFSSGADLVAFANAGNFSLETNEVSQ